jgi:hypothetical protein
MGDFEDRKAKFTEEYNALVVKYGLTIGTQFIVVEKPAFVAGISMPPEETSRDEGAL